MQRLRREGVNLFYEEAAGGEPAVLPVHGWCCGHTYSTQQHVIVSAMQSLHDYDPDSVDPPEVPGVYMAADELQPRPDMSRFHDMFPDIFYGKTVGSGHFCQLEVPEQIGAKVDRFPAVALPR